MSLAHKSPTMQVDLTLSKFDIADRIKLAALIAKFAPKSAIYGSDAVVKDSADALINDGVALDAANKDAEAKKQAYLAAIATRDALQQQFDTDAAVLKASAEKA